MRILLSFSTCYHTDETDGRIVVLLPHEYCSVAARKKKYAVSDQGFEQADAIIDFREFVSYTNIPVVILFESKRNGNSGNILFIDAKSLNRAKFKMSCPMRIQKIVDAILSVKM